MAQPLGQIQVDPSHPLAGFFAYANASGMWDAQAGAMLAKTGTGAVVDEGGVKVATSASDTNYTLPAVLDFPGAVSFGFRCRLTAANDRSMVIGNPAITQNYIWLNKSGKTQLGGTVLGDNNGVITMETWYFTREGPWLPTKMYKNGVLIGTVASTGGNGFSISSLLKPYPSNTSYDFHGSLEFAHILPAGKLLSAAEVASLSANPYQVLLGGGGGGVSPPNLEGSITLVSKTQSVITIAWPAATGTTAATGYAVSKDAGVSWTQLGLVQSYSFTGLTVDTPYNLRVRATAPGDIVSTPALELLVRTNQATPDTTIPELSGVIAVTDKSHNSISISWPSGTDNEAVVGYEVSSDAGAAWVSIGNVLQYTFSSLSPATNYELRVRAKDSAGLVSSPALARLEQTSSAPAGNIVLTSPTARMMRQRTMPAGTAVFTVSGTYTQTPGKIEWRWKGGAWSTLVDSPSGGVFSASVTLPTGQGTLDVRFTSDTSVTASAVLVTVGDIYVTAGQSNNAGASQATVLPVASNFQALQRMGGEWVNLREGQTAATSYCGQGGKDNNSGSYVGQLSNLLQSQNVPLGFIPTAQGSTTADNWKKSGWGHYKNMQTAIEQVGGVRAVIWWQGEGDALNSASVEVYEPKIQQIINDIFSDFGVPTFIVKIVKWIAAADAIRTAQDNIIATNPNVAGWADGDPYTGGVHYVTEQGLRDVAGRIYAGMLPAFYPAPLPTTFGFFRWTGAAWQSIQ